MRKPFVVSNVVWAAALGLAASTCHAQPAGGLTKQTINLRGGGSIEAEHGTLEVPENRANSDSRKISLAFVRVRSPLPNPGPPVFMLAGGPGGSGIELVTRSAPQKEQGPHEEGLAGSGPPDRNRTCIWRLGGARSIH